VTDRGRAGAARPAAGQGGPQAGDSKMEATCRKRAEAVERAMLAAARRAAAAAGAAEDDDAVERLAAAISAELRRAEAAAYERAARAAEESFDCAWCDSKHEIAAAIRAMKRHAT